MCTLRDTRAERFPGEYYGQREVDEVAAEVRASGARGAVGEEAVGRDIPYPLCSECGKRHPPLDWLQETGQGICDVCGRVQGLPREPAFEDTWPEPGKLVARRKLVNGQPAWIPSEWVDERGYSRFVDYLPLHKNERGQWCKRPIRILTVPDTAQ